MSCLILSYQQNTDVLVYQVLGYTVHKNDKYFFLFKERSAYLKLQLKL